MFVCKFLYKLLKPLHFFLFLFPCFLLVPPLLLVSSVVFAYIEKITIYFTLLTQSRYTVILSLRGVILMIVNDLMEQYGMTKYRLSQDTHIPYMTINDIMIKVEVL